MDSVLFQVGNIEIKWYSFLLLVAVLAGISLFMYEGKRHNYPKDYLFNLCFWAVIFGFLGARAYYVIFNWSAYASNPVSIFKIWEGGLAIHGGLIAGFTTVVCYCKKYKVRLFKNFDIATI